MNYNKKSVLDADVKGKKVLLRCDFNVPQNKFLLSTFFSVLSKEMNMNVRYIMKYASSTKAKVRERSGVQIAHKTRRGTMERDMMQKTIATFLTSLFSIVP